MGGRNMFWMLQHRYEVVEGVVSELSATRPCV